MCCETYGRSEASLKECMHIERNMTVLHNLGSLEGRIVAFDMAHSHLWKAEQCVAENVIAFLKKKKLF